MPDAGLTHAGAGCTTRLDLNPDGTQDERWYE